MSKLYTTLGGGVARVLAPIYGEILCNVPRVMQMSFSHFFVHSSETYLLKPSSEEYTSSEGKQRHRQL